LTGYLSCACADTPPAARNNATKKLTRRMLSSRGFPILLFFSRHASGSGSAT
jgi:hypothetical protein